MLAKKKNQSDSQAKAPQAEPPEMYIDIVGIAPSDLQVATYIERLSNSELLDNVALVESKERKIENTIFREFKLTAIPRTRVRLVDNSVLRTQVKL